MNVPRWTRKVALSGGLAVAAAAIAVPLSTGSGAASAAPAPLASVTSAADVGAPGAKLPAALKADLKAAWAAPDGKRVAALTAVLDKAVAGAYGDQVKARATRIKARLAAMDPQLRTDLAAAVELPKDQRRAALKAIMTKVRAGGYGEAAQQHAKALRHLLRHRLRG